MTIELKDAKEKVYYTFDTLQEAKNTLIVCHLPYLNIYKDGKKLTHKDGKGVLIYTNKYNKGNSLDINIDGIGI